MDGAAIVAFAAGAVFVLVALMAGYASQDTTPPIPADVPSDLAVVYSFGYGKHITLDTGKGIFSVGMCDDPPVQNAMLVFSKQETELMWKSISKNDFFTLGDLTEPCLTYAANCRAIDPEQTASLQVIADGRTHTVNYRQDYELNHSDDSLKRFKDITGIIEGILAQHPDLPKSHCAFM